MKPLLLFAILIIFAKSSSVVTVLHDTDDSGCLLNNNLWITVNHLNVCFGANDISDFAYQLENQKIVIYQHAGISYCPNGIYSRRNELINGSCFLCTHFSNWMNPQKVFLFDVFNISITYFDYLTSNSIFTFDFYFDHNCKNISYTNIVSGCSRNNIEPFNNTTPGFYFSANDFGDHVSLRRSENKCVNVVETVNRMYNTCYTTFSGSVIWRKPFYTATANTATANTATTNTSSTTTTATTATTTTKVSNGNRLTIFDKL
jgi:hypothetical protein